MQVVFFHFGAAFAARHGAPSFIVQFLENGKNAVSLFFVLSGFILTYTYAGQLSRPGGVKRFYQARFARIYPVYLLSMAIGCLLAWPTLTALAACLTMTQAWPPWNPSLAGAINTPAWTLSVEAAFYLAFPLWLPLLLRRRAATLRWSAAVLIAVIVFGHTLMDPGCPQNCDFLGGAAWPSWIPLPIWRMPEFVLGILAGLHFLRTPRERPAPVMLYAGIAAYVALYASVTIRWESLLILPHALLIYTLARAAEMLSKPWPARLLSSRIAVTLGGASYAIYLLQEELRAALSRIWPATAPHRDTLLPATHIALLLAASITVFYLYEEPARRWLRKQFAHADA